MTTEPIQSITDEQIAEIEARANDAAPFDWSPYIGMTHAETLYAYSVGPDSILALIARLRSAERDAARYIELAVNANENCRIAANYLSIYRPQLADEFFVFANNIDRAMKGEQQ